MTEFIAGLSPWLTHGAILAAGILMGILIDLFVVYRAPPDLRGD